MFKKSIDARLSDWANLRKKIETAKDPYHILIEFWKQAPLVSHNHKIDPYDFKSWPTPWEILAENKYDDFTLALMMGYSLKLTERFKKDNVKIKTMVDYSKTKLYNLVFVNEDKVLNYMQDTSVSPFDIDSQLYIENIVDVVFPR